MGTILLILHYNSEFQQYITKIKQKKTAQGQTKHRFKSKAIEERKRINLIINQNQLRKDTLPLS